MNDEKGAVLVKLLQNRKEFLFFDRAKFLLVPFHDLSFLIPAYGENTYR